MDKELWIPVDDFCLHYQIEQSFVSNLYESGLIEITTIEETGCIHANQLSSLEKYVRLYYDLQINVEGIEAITHLLDRIKELQHEVRRLKQETTSLHFSE
jgi:hypothetical protein